MQGKERHGRLAEFWYENFLGSGKFETAEEMSGLLGSFAKLRKTTISFVMSVRPPALSNSSRNGQIFMKFKNFSKICQEDSSFFKI